jgi:hypothetical protein
MVSEVASSQEEVSRTVAWSVAFAGLELHSDIRQTHVRGGINTSAILPHRIVCSDSVWPVVRQDGLASNLYEWKA